MTDLPARPASDAEPHRIVEATERVKSVSDKTDPRFEAALNKVDRADARRAKAETAEPKTKKDKYLKDEASDEDSSETEAQQDRPVRPSSTSFSFNKTSDDDSDQADTEDVQ